MADYNSPESGPSGSFSPLVGVTTGLGGASQAFGWAAEPGRQDKPTQPGFWNRLFHRGLRAE